MTASPAISKDRLLPMPDGSYRVSIVGDGIPAGAVLSVQRDGSISWRTDEQGRGGWECGRVEGNKWIVRDNGYPLGAYALLVV